MRLWPWLAVLGLGCEDPESFDGDTDTLPTTTQTGASTQTGGTNTDVGLDPFGMVSAHNAVRAGAQPIPDPALPPMVWDAEMEALAQDWADRCDFNHSTHPYGENLYVSTSPNEGTRAVESWASEAADYDYASNQCRAMCGHYTQIVWRDSTRVGCAYADCDVLTGAGFSSGRLWVCNYDPPGNWMGERPY